MPEEQMNDGASSNRFSSFRRDFDSWLSIYRKYYKLLNDTLKSALPLVISVAAVIVSYNSGFLGRELTSKQIAFTEAQVQPMFRAEGKHIPERKGGASHTGTISNPVWRLDDGSPGDENIIVKGHYEYVLSYADAVAYNVTPVAYVFDNEYNQPAVACTKYLAQHNTLSTPKTGATNVYEWRIPEIMHPSSTNEYLEYCRGNGEVYLEQSGHYPHATILLQVKYIDVFNTNRTMYFLLTQNSPNALLVDEALGNELVSFHHDLLSAKQIHEMGNDTPEIKIFKSFADVLNGRLNGTYD